MQPLALWPLDARRQIGGVLTDIDDTLTTDGQVPPSTVAALGALQAAGLHVIAITGRPVGWSLPFAAAWPVDAIVAENGAVALLPRAGQVTRRYQQDSATRERNLARMQAVVRRIVREVPGAVASQDSPGRETDVAIDHSEFTQLSPARIAEVVAILRAEGMNATVSSIHINGWYGAHNKLEGARWIVRELLGRDLDLEMNHWAYVGDSTNDQLMFEAFAQSVGVANVRRFEAQLTHKPHYIAQGARGAGFEEFAAALLGARAQGARPG